MYARRRIIKFLKHDINMLTTLLIYKRCFLKNILTYLENSSIRHPNKTAIAFRDELYTFSELMIMAKKIGARIREFQITNQPVGVFATQSIRTAAFFLGVLYSGNFYVPLDPDMPKEKLQAIFDDACFKVILGEATAKPLVDMLDYGGALLDDQDLPEKLSPFPSVGDTDPLYMVYTSGSTGKPKGVLKSHRAEICYLEAYCETFAFTGDEVIGNQTPFFFDASAKDFYMMLKMGCTLEILPSTLFTLPPELMDYLNDRKITFASWVPTALSLVAQLNPFSMVKPETLKRLFFVGEVMPMKHLNIWREALPEIQYVNLYGQSEIAGICCYYEVKGEFDNSSVLPIGLPLKNCRIYLLDQGKIVTEPNHIGEMYIVSEALATEYYRDSEKTGKSFITMDFGTGPERCFKTGDLAQYDMDGNLLFASRKDFQIKHMGHRIELGEIEAVADAHPEIARCCCLYQAEKRKIILFCQLNAGVKKAGREIQSELRPKLSSYMLPGKVIVMERLPMSANGKIDRQALKAQL